MASEARFRGRRSRQQQTNKPIIHFYEEFVKKSSARHGESKPKKEMIRSSQQRRSKSATASMSPDTLTTKSTIATRVDPSSGPVSPLTPKEQTLLPNNRGRTSEATTKASVISKNQRDKEKPWETTQSRAKTPPKRLSLYERSQLRLKEREKKIQDIRNEVMRECTFRPNTKNSFAKRNPTKNSKTRASPNVSTPASNTEATTPTTTTSSSRQYWRDLQQKQQEQQASTASKDGSKTVSTIRSLRFEELYQDGVRKARQRPTTEKAEEELRKKRLEDRELKECTFKPKTHWGRKRQTYRRQPEVSGTTSQESNAVTTLRGGHRTLSPRRKLFTSLSPRRRLFEPEPRLTKPLSSFPHSVNKDSIPNILGSRMGQEKKPQSPLPHPVNKNSIPDILGSQMDQEKEEDPSLDSLSLLRQHRDLMRERSNRPDSPIPPIPLEIITTGVRPMSPVPNRPWRALLYRWGDSFSPLPARTLGIEIDKGGPKSPLAPRVIFCGTTVGGDESEAAHSQMTEYGSI